ncbi:hypothetical protein RND81_05G107700 [Saponaria officinalis]|uniref:F-box domain-containing protein n=1 Tax=Saponaria officinalis TaxID=3572 RepID=A0AAW1KVB2_SAPOF
MPQSAIKPENDINPSVGDVNYNINDLTDGLLVEILVRVPTCKSAQQCKCVCKRWRSLISTPYFARCFINLHACRVSDPVMLLHQYRYFAYHDIEPDAKVTVISHPVHTKVDAVTDHPVLRTRTSFELDFLPFCQTADILAASEDLLVCYDRWTSFELLRHGRGATFCVCNVLTREWIALPPSPSSYWKSGLVGFITYTADPCSTKVTEHIHNYKLVHISRDKEFSAEVFSSETGEWSKTAVLSCARFTLHEKCITNAVTFRRKLHWIINDESILAFDPFGTDNNFRLIDQPELEEEGQSTETECIGVCNDRLLVSKVVRVDGKHKVIIWDLKDYNKGEWCLMHEVRFNEIRDHQLGFGDVACLLAFDPREKTVLYMRYKDQILKCNVQERILEVISKCSKSWTWHLTNERDTAFSLVHPCWPSPVRLS